MNTAPKEVLSCLPGLDGGDADALIALRSSSGADLDQHRLGAGALTQAKAIGISNFITTKTKRFSADIVAASGDGRGFKRLRCVFDMTGTVPKMLYSKDLTHLGWPLDPQILEDLRQGRVPAVQSTPFQQGSSTGTKSAVGRIELMAKTVLGIAFGPGLIQVAELSYDAASARLLRAADFLLTGGDTLDKPLELGKKFGAFLKDKKFSAKQAIAGLPTQWLMLKEKNVPAMNAENLAGVLRLQAERDFSLEPTDLILDYAAGESDGKSARALLLTATLRDRVEHIAAVLKTAGLTARVLTSSALALATASYAGTLVSVGRVRRGNGRARERQRVRAVRARVFDLRSTALGRARCRRRPPHASRCAPPIPPRPSDCGTARTSTPMHDRRVGARARRARHARSINSPAWTRRQNVPNAQRFGHAAALARLAKNRPTPPR